MSKIFQGFGSEWHMRTLLARSPEVISQAVLSVLSESGINYPSDINWHPNYLELGKPELRGLDFLPIDSPVRLEWVKHWPSQGNVHNWDGISSFQKEGGDKEWLLIEAKANLQEVRSNCGAKGMKEGEKAAPGGLTLIKATLEKAQEAIGISREKDWTRGHYQYANRLALLHFLHSHGIAARLVFLYFSGDAGGGNRNCPDSPDGWTKTLRDMKKSLGLTGESNLEQHVHEIFLTVGDTGGSVQPVITNFQSEIP